MVRFLQHRLRHLPGRLLVLWDGAPIHHARPVKAFLAAGAAARLQLEPLPGYAPDLNPLDQGSWQHLKPVELANVCCTGLRHLRRVLQEYVAYFDADRPHRSLGLVPPLPGAPPLRASSGPPARVVARPILGGLRHADRRAA